MGLGVRLFDGFEAFDVNERAAAVLAQPLVSTVPDDRQHPVPRIAIGETCDRAKCAQAGFLHDVFGIRAVSGQAACQHVRLREIGKDNARELLVGAKADRVRVVAIIWICARIFDRT